MNGGVHFEVGLVVEAGAAHHTHVRFAIRVDLDVRVQVGDAVERLAALVARVGLDGGVRELVARQVARLAEGATAYVALERLLARMNALNNPKYQQNKHTT